MIDPKEWQKIKKMEALKAWSQITVPELEAIQRVAKAVASGNTDDVTGEDLVIFWKYADVYPRKGTKGEGFGTPTN